jgi:hypothetical protein
MLVGIDAGATLAPTVELVGCYEDLGSAAE